MPVMKNMEAVLELQISHSLCRKCTIFIKNMDEFGTSTRLMDNISITPAGKQFEVSKLQNVNVEISLYRVK